MKTIIRPIQANDDKDLHALYAETFDTPWELDFFHHVINNNQFSGLASVIDRTLIGFILVQSVQDEADLLTFIVSEKYRRKGVGRELLGEALKQLKSHEVTKLYLEVAVDNEYAIQLYQGLDFETVGRRPGYYRRSSDKVVDGLLMMKDLRR